MLCHCMPTEETRSTFISIFYQYDRAEGLLIAYVLFEKTQQNCHLAYSKTWVKRLFKNRQNNLMTNGSLMKVKSIAERSPWSIMQYF